MNLKPLAVVLSLVFCTSILRGQSPSPMDFFPHHKGDIWEYRDPRDTTVKYRNEILSDSLAPDGCFYLETTVWGKFRIDTVRQEVWDRSWGGPDYSDLHWKLAADSGDTWQITPPGAYSDRYARVRDLRGFYGWGLLTVVKRIDVFQNGSPVLYTTDHLAAGLGLVEWDNDAFPVMVLWGAIIGGKRYGVITSVPSPSQPGTVPHQVFLEQNFPNPFNGSSVIGFTLPRAMAVRLTLCNALGQTLRSIVGGVIPAGRHTLRVDARELASGMYFAVLETAEGRLVRKMLLTK